jgi:hypothetical protein
MATDVGAIDLIDVAHRVAIETDVQPMASELQKIFGQKLVAYAIGDRHPKSVGRYARGERNPDDDALARLTDLYQVMRVLQGDRPAPSSWMKKWMLGSNARLGGTAPAQAFHEGKTAEVLGAARAFVLQG